MRKSIILSSLIILTIVVISTTLYYTIYQEEEGTPLMAQEDIPKIDFMLEQILEEREELGGWVSHDQIGYLHRNQSDFVIYQKDTENFFRLLFYSLTTHDVDLFVTLFDTQQISRDLFEDERFDKMEVSSEIMERITVADTLKDISYVENDSNTIREETIIMNYEEEINIRLDLDIHMEEGDHHGDSDTMMFIKTSVWDIIKKIENH